MMLMKLSDVFTTLLSNHHESTELKANKQIIAHFFKSFPNSMISD